MTCVAVCTEVQRGSRVKTQTVHEQVETCCLIPRPLDRTAEEDQPKDDKTSWVRISVQWWDTGKNISATLIYYINTVFVEEMTVLQSEDSESEEWSQQVR